MTTTPIDLDFYCFRERATELDGERLLVPHDDGMRYEYPVDLIFESALQAEDWKEENYPDGGVVETGLPQPKRRRLVRRRCSVRAYGEQSESNGFRGEH